MWAGMGNGGIGGLGRVEGGPGGASWVGDRVPKFVWGGYRGVGKVEGGSGWGL